jgi:PAS domain S-box-containing protein
VRGKGNGNGERQTAYESTNSIEPDARSAEVSTSEIETLREVLRRKNRELDIERRARARTERHAARLFEDGAVGRLVLDESGVILACNDFIRLRLARADEELLGASLESTLHPEDRGKARSQLQLLAEGVGRHETLLRFVAKSGKQTHARVSGVAEREKGGGARFHITIVDVSERALVEEKLIAQRRMARLMSEHSLQGVVTAQTSGIIFANPKFCEIVDRSFEELAATTLDDLAALAHPDDRTRARRRLVDLVANVGTPQSFEARVVRKDGSVHWVEIYPVRYYAEGEVGVHASVIDVTKRKRYEEEIRSREERFRALYEYAAIGIFQTTLDNRFLMANPAFRRIFGIPNDAPLDRYRPAALYAFTEDRGAVLSALYRNGEIENELMEFKRLDGSRFFASISARLVRDADDAADYIEGTLIDVTNRVEYEKRIKTLNRELEVKVNQRAAELKALIEQAPVAVGVFDRSGAFREGNSAWERLDEGTSKELSLVELPPLVQSGYEQRIAEIVHNGGQLRTLPVRHETSQGERVFIFNIYSLFTRRSKDSGVVCIVEDITDQMRYEEAKAELAMQRLVVEKTIEKLEEDRKVVAEELHDCVGQQLMLAKLNVELYEQQTGAKNERLEEAKANVVAIGDDIRRIMRSLRPAALERAGLKEALEQLCDSVRDAAEFTMDVDIDDEVDQAAPNVKINVYRLTQEALNNILKHAHASNVKVRARVTERRGVRLIVGSVSDDGVGISKGVFRGGVEFRSYGLVNMKERMRMLGGYCDWVSVPDKGTEIRFRTPLEATNGKRVDRGR